MLCVWAQPREREQSAQPGKLRHGSSCNSVHTAVFAVQTAPEIQIQIQIQTSGFLQLDPFGRPGV